MEKPSGAVKTCLEMIESGELTAEDVRENAEEFSQDSNPFRKVVGEVYLKALPFLKEEQA